MFRWRSATPKTAAASAPPTMANALQSGRPHRASGALANHVLEIMLAFDKSSKLGAKVELTTSCERPAPLPLGLEEGQLPE